MGAGLKDVHLFKYLKDIIPNWPLVLVIVMLFVIVGTLFYLVIAALAFNGSYTRRLSTISNRL